MYARRTVLITSSLFVLLSLLGSLSMLQTYNIGPKYIIENICTDTLGVRMTIGELHLNAEQGTARLGHVQISIPRDFPTARRLK